MDWILYDMDYIRVNGIVSVYDMDNVVDIVRHGQYNGK